MNNNENKIVIGWGLAFTVLFTGALVALTRNEEKKTSSLFNSLAWADVSNAVCETQADPVQAQPDFPHVIAPLVYQSDNTGDGRALLKNTLHTSVKFASCDTAEGDAVYKRTPAGDVIVLNASARPEFQQAASWEIMTDLIHNRLDRSGQHSVMANESMAAHFPGALNMTQPVTPETTETFWAGKHRNSSWQPFVNPPLPYPILPGGK